MRVMKNYKNAEIIKFEKELLKNGYCPNCETKLVVKPGGIFHCCKCGSCGQSNDLKDKK